MADDQDSPQITPQDRDIAIRTMIGEENSPDGMAGVASVLLNRAKAGNYGGNSLAGVAFAPHQFESWDNPQKLLAISPTDPNYQRAAKIFDGVASGQIPDLTSGATNFYAPNLQSERGQPAPSWAKGKPVALGSSLFYAPNGGQTAAPTNTAPAHDPETDYPVAPPATALASTQADPLADYPIAPAKNAVDEPPVTGPGGTIGVMTPEMEAEFRAKGEAPASPIASAAASAPSAPGATPDFLTDYLVAPSTGSASPPPPPGYSANGQPVSRSLAMAGSFLNGAPIIGPYLEKGVENAAAWARSKLTGEDQSQVLNEMRQRVADSQNAYSKSAALSGLTGGVVATVPAMALAPAAFGINSAVGPFTNAIASGVTGGVIGGADAGARSGWNLANLERGGAIGGLFGAAAPLAGSLIGSGVNAASNLLSRTTPAAHNIANVFEAAGISPLQAEMTLARMGPNATLADIDPALTGEASGLAALGGRPTSILKNAYAARAANADDRMSQIVDRTLGPKPDAQGILEDIRQREGDLAFDAPTARSALDSAMGPSTDPHTVLQSMVAKRSVAAQPLYEKAFRGGSIAPLEKQFEGAFSDAANAVSEASKDLASARQQQLLAKAKISNAGENVYGANHALNADREAQISVNEAEQKLAQAEKNKNDILTRLRQAQQDGSMNKPGAVWNPRIQQFLDDPIMQAGLAKGVRIQRLESLADGKPFNPTEYAITGFNEAGDPVVGSVPNMRTLNVAKKGLDAMVEAAKDPITGRLSEEGRAIDKVRSSFLSELDKVNPDYKAARAAWAGPSQTQDAFNRGLSLFRNQTGPSGVNSTAGALSAWMKTATDGEKEAAKAGARAAFEQQMTTAGDPAARAASITNKEANRAKLDAILGPDEAQKLTKQLSFRYEDPVGKAFTQGLGVFKSRGGLEGISDTPDAWAKLVKSSSPGELEALRQGARQAIEQALTMARQGDVSAARSLFAKSTANRQKLEMLFPNGGKMLDGLDNELKMRSTENEVMHNSQTAARQAIRNKYAPTQSDGGIGATAPLVGEAIYGGPGAAIATAARAAYKGVKNSYTEAARARLNEGTARGLSSTGADQEKFIGQIERAASSGRATNAISKGGSALVNLYTRNGGKLLPQFTQ